jgi:putative ABC transport system permease protein
MGTRILRGRSIATADVKGAEPVAVIDETFARDSWGGESPLGKILVLDGPPTLPGRRVRIVGVAESVPMSRLDAAERPAFYLPFAQGFEGHYLNWGMDLVVRVADGANRKAEITQAVRAAFPDAAVFHLEKLDDLVAESMSARRFQLLLMLTFGIVALGLSVVGVSALLFLSVRQEQRELGVYLALGARPRQLWWRVQRQGATLVLAGVAIGVGAALAGAGLFTSLVYGYSVRDPIAFLAGPVLLAIAGFAAASLPAVRAMRTDPIRLLREE